MILHPALIMLAAGIIIPFAPLIVRKIMMIVAPLFVLFASYSLKYGQIASIPFINNMELVYLKVDELSWVFIFILAIVSLTANLYAFKVESRIEVSAQFLYVASSMGVVLAGDWMTLIFFWELMALSSVFLVWCRKEEESKKAGFRYLLVHFFGGNLLLAGIFLKVSQGQYLITSLADNLDLAGILILIGVAINAAIYPLHAWLPDAYPKGTITGSVFMSFLTTKVAVFCLIRIFPGTKFLIISGLLMAIIAVIYAMIADDIREILSFDVVSQVGYMVAAVGVGSELALNGATAHAFSHIIYNSLLFMGAGAMIYVTGLSKLSEMIGIGRKVPGIIFLYFIGSMAISGFPYLNGFTSKSVILSAATLGGYPHVELFLYLISIGTLISTSLRVIYFMLLKNHEEETKVIKKLPKNMYGAMIITAALCFIYGIFPNLLYNRLPFEINYVPYTFDHVISTLQILFAATFAFILFVNIMKPKEAFLVDADWFYRVPLVALTNAIVSFVIYVQEGLGKIWLKGIESTYPTLRNPLRWLQIIDGQVKGPDEYNENYYRFHVGAAVTVCLIIFISSYFYISM